MTIEEMSGGSVSRRDVLKATAALGGALALGQGLIKPVAASSPWTIVALPDTQKYTMSSEKMAYVKDQIDWIINNRSAKNIVFVAHEGDLVEHGSDTTQWQRISNELYRLDSVLPYSTAIGNHDYAVTGDRSSSLANYQKYFGHARYATKSWFGGARSDDRGQYQRFTAGGYTFLHLSLEWGVPGTQSDPATVMGWADGILKQNASVPTIITTHSYVWDKAGYEGHATAGQGANSGRKIFRNLVKRHKQVFLVLNGHWHKSPDGEWRQLSKNNAGLPIYEMLANYQHYANGGDGWLRFIEFIPGGGANGKDRIQVRTYSPSKQAYQTDDSGTGRASQFSYDLSFASRFGNVSSAGLSLPALAFGLGARTFFPSQRETDDRQTTAGTIVDDRSDRPRKDAEQPPAMAGVPRFDRSKTRTPASELGLAPVSPPLV